MGKKRKIYVKNSKKWKKNRMLCKEKKVKRTLYARLSFEKNLLKAMRMMLTFWCEKLKWITKWKVKTINSNWNLKEKQKTKKLTIRGWLFQLLFWFKISKQTIRMDVMKMRIDFFLFWITKKTETENPNPIMDVWIENFLGDKIKIAINDDYWTTSTLVLCLSLSPISLIGVFLFFFWLKEKSC